MPQATNELETLRYPVGRFVLDATPTSDKRAAWIATIEETPARMRDAVAGLSDTQLDTPYRRAGWTVRQVVHHVADSHINAYVRLKLALTEPAPAIKGYDEALWAELPDARLPVAVSLDLLDALHTRWSALFRSMKEEAFARQWLHPDHGARDLDFLLQLYSWHSRHHAAHIRSLRERMGWR